MLIAIPSEAPGGLDAAISQHFGHCAAFTLVRLEDGQLGEVRILPNGGHEQGGCMAPVMLLKQHGVEALVAGGMGGRPLAGFQQVGIQVFFREDAQTVQQAVELLRADKCRVFGPAQTCGGHGEGEGGCGGHDHGHDHEVERPALQGPAIVQADRVVSFDFELKLASGEVVESSRNSQPVSYLHGRRQILPALEAALEGLQPGEERQVVLQPAQAFGEHDAALTHEVPRKHLPADLNEGDVLNVRRPDGQAMPVKVLSLSEASAMLDGNHLLAGETVSFEVRIREVLAATPEELAHGHAH